VQASPIYSMHERRDNAQKKAIGSSGVFPYTTIETGLYYRGCCLWLVVCLVLVGLGFNKENALDYLCDINDLTITELVGIVVCYPLCAVMAFTFLEVREDIILPPRENSLRGVGLSWTRSRSYWYMYFEFPIGYVRGVVAFLYLRGFHLISFADCSHECWLRYGAKMVLSFVVYEFIMYSMHRTWHASPWLYKIAHKEHHVQMDFPAGPYAPLIEQVSANIAAVFACKIVGLSAGSFIIMVNLLITQCVLEHSYSSLHIPVWHDCFFSTADVHQAHHTNSHGNFGYALNIFDNVFGTYHPEEDGKKLSYLEKIGPATACRLRLLRRCKLTEHSQEQQQQDQQCF